MTEHDFARALLNPDLPVPQGLVGPQGGPVARRFAIYRNNVTHGLTEALEAGFPVLRKLVGEAFFAAMAREFLREHPPDSRILMFYGAALPAFLEGFPPVSHLGYLPDVARLEQALRESYHAADAAPLPTSDLAALTAADPAQLRLRLAPTLRMVASRWPLHAIWLAQTADGPAPVAGAQDVIVLRPEFDPQVHLLPPGGARMIGALSEGASLADAAALAGPKTDLAAVLTLLVQGGAITGVAA